MIIETGDLCVSFILLLIWIEFGVGKKKFVFKMGINHGQVLREKLFLTFCLSYKQAIRTNQQLLNKN